MTPQTNHDTLVEKVRGVLKEYGFFVEDKEGEMLKYLNEKYCYHYNSKPDLVCSSIKSLDTYTDFAIEAKTFESIKHSISDGDKKQFQEINSAVPTFLLVYRNDYEKMKNSNYFKEVTDLGLGLVVYNETEDRIDEISEAKSKINNVPLGNISLKHRIYQIFTSKKVFEQNHPHGVLFTKNNFINLIKWNRDNSTISHELDISNFHSESWLKFKQYYIQQVHEFLDHPKVRHDANCFWSFHVGVGETTMQIFGYDLPSFILAVEKIIFSHDTHSKMRTKLKLLNDQPVIEPWHNTHFEFFIWGNPGYYSRPHLLAIKGKIDFITRRGAKSTLGYMRLESGRIISSLVHTNYIEAFSKYKGIDISYSIGKKESELPQKLELSDIQFVPSISTFSRSLELEYAYFIANYNGVGVGVYTPYPEVIKKLFFAKKPIKVSCKNRKMASWDLEGEGIIEFIQVDN